MSLTDQIISVISQSAIDGGSLYNYDATKAGAKKKRASKKKPVEPVQEPVKGDSLVLNAGCAQCGHECVGCKAGAKKKVTKKVAIEVPACEPESPESPKLAGKRKMSAAGRAKCKAGAAASPWIKFVKEYAKDHNLTFPQALKEAGKTYKK